MSIQYDAYTEERLSNARTRYSYNFMTGTFFGIMGGFLAIYLLFEYNHWYLTHPWVSVHSRVKPMTNFYAFL